MRCQPLCLAADGFCCFFIFCNQVDLVHTTSYAPYGSLFYIFQVSNFLVTVLLPALVIFKIFSSFYVTLCYCFIQCLGKWLGDDKSAGYISQSRVYFDFPHYIYWPSTIIFFACFNFKAFLSS